MNERFGFTVFTGRYKVLDYHKADGQQIATADDEESARIIVRALNRHDELVSAARKAVNLMSYLHWESDPHGRKDKAEVFAELSAALSAVDSQKGDETCTHR